MTSSVLTSQSVIITTAMAAVSAAVILLSLCRIKSNLPLTQNSPSLRSCLSSERLKGDSTNRKKTKKKKRVKFAEDVKDERSEPNYVEKKMNKSRKVSKLREIMPPNRAALYHGILRDRVHRLQSC